MKKEQTISLERQVNGATIDDYLQDLFSDKPETEALAVYLSIMEYYQQLIQLRKAPKTAI